MANYPGAYYDPRAKENKSGIVYDAAKKTIVFVEDFNSLEEEILAIEETLGLDAGSLVDRVEGNGTRNVLRSVVLRFQPGATPGTNVNISLRSAANYGFNAPEITNAVNLAKSGTEGSFSLAANGSTITMNLTEDIVGIVGSGFGIMKWNSASTTEMYTALCYMTDGSIVISFYKRGATTATDITAIMDAGDMTDVWLSFITST